MAEGDDKHKVEIVFELNRIDPQRFIEWIRTEVEAGNERADGVYYNECRVRIVTTKVN